MPQACFTFVSEHGEKIIRKNLMRNLSLHLTSLYDFGLLEPKVICQTLLKLSKLRETIEEEGKNGTVCFTNSHLTSHTNGAAESKFENGDSKHPS